MDVYKGDHVWEGALGRQFAAENELLGRQATVLVQVGGRTAAIARLVSSTGHTWRSCYVGSQYDGCQTTVRGG